MTTSTDPARAPQRLTPEQLVELRQELERRRDELRRQSEANLRAGTYVEDELIESVDVANQERESSDRVGLAEQQRGLLAEIEMALERMDRGTYGLSEASGRPIPFKRLAALPWARYDAHEEEARERGLG